MIIKFLCNYFYKNKKEINNIGLFVLLIFWWDEYFKFVFFIKGVENCWDGLVFI